MCTVKDIKMCESGSIVYTVRQKHFSLHLRDLFLFNIGSNSGFSIVPGEPSLEQLGLLHQRSD